MVRAIVGTLLMVGKNKITLNDFRKIIEAKNRRQLFEHLKSEGIFCQIHYIPIHFMPYYQSLGWKKDDLPKVANYYQNCISLPMYPELSEQEQLFVIKSIKEFYHNKNVLYH
jgi:dTDP-4-amino-4,6-dideoxygalactose transaminase